MNNKTHGLRSWIDELNNAELPAMAVVVHDLLRLSQSTTASVRQLAEVLMRDASLTSKVLRVSNSVYCNPGREVVRTISRAVVVVGFDQVRMIGLSVSLLDGLLKESPREQLQSLLARSFHGAVQARNLAQHVCQQQKEEVFIATLLLNLGELAFWSRGGKPADELVGALADVSVDREKLVKRMLGTGFDQLTLGLLKSWNMGEIGQLVQASQAARGPAAIAVALGAELADAVAADGWTSPAVQALIEPIGSLTGLPPEEAWRQMLGSGEEAVRIAGTCANSDLKAWIPRTDDLPLDLSDLLQMQRESSAQEVRPIVPMDDAPLLQPDLELLKLSLQNLRLMARMPTDVDSALSSLMQALHRGAGFERVMLAVLAERQSCFKARKVAGKGSEGWLQGFTLPHDPTSTLAFARALKQRSMQVVTPFELADQPLGDLLLEQVGEGAFAVAPVLAGERQVGVLYVDMRLSGRPMADTQLSVLRKVAELAGLTLRRLSQG
ncbi:HDOD domain-containing protein [Halopseudomonas sp.]|uniref:HDOD domain-containing protein n=1 Tax=Halopseudomonas sp. TaxID=2901191 RepID=UPI003001E127